MLFIILNVSMLYPFTAHVDSRACDIYCVQPIFTARLVSRTLHKVALHSFPKLFHRRSLTTDSSRSVLEKAPQLRADTTFVFMRSRSGQGKTIACGSSRQKQQTPCRLPTAPQDRAGRWPYEGYRDREQCSETLFEPKLYLYREEA